MGQEEIARILSRSYPRYISYLDITFKCTISKRSVMRCLKSLEKRDEIEYKIVQGTKPGAGWKKMYRLKGGKHNERKRIE